MDTDCLFLAPERDSQGFQQCLFSGSLCPWNKNGALKCAYYASPFSFRVGDWVKLREKREDMVIQSITNGGDTIIPHRIYIIKAISGGGAFLHFENQGGAWRWNNFYLISRKVTKEVKEKFRLIRL